MYQIAHEVWCDLSLVLYPGPGRRRKKGLVPIARTCVISRTLGRGRRAKKHTVICGTPDFLGVVDACACNRYQALLLPLKGPGYEASVIYLEPRMIAS